MALQVCLSCTAAYAVGAEACPQCGSTEWRPDWEEEDMPRTTVANGPTNPWAAPGETGYMPEVHETPRTSEPSEDDAAGAPAEAKPPKAAKAKASEPKWPGDGDE